MRWLLITGLAASTALQAAPSDVVSQASGAALQADAARALKLMKGLDASKLPSKDAQFVGCMRSRFARPVAVKPSSPSFADRALAIYKTYWQHALVKPESRAEEEHKLEAALRKLLNADKAQGLDALEPKLEKRLSAQGWHSLEGRTGLLLELMLWNKQDEQLVTVRLPEGEYRVRVVLLDGFKSFGWSHYATCGRRATGGWATDDALFAVVPRYESLDNEEFKVTFLGHEAQHLADKARFKALKSWELEYRAKLTELALANETRTKVLRKFIEDQGDDPRSPHSYADRRLLDDLRERLDLKSVNELTAVDPARLQSAARRALLEDSRQRAAAGQLKVPTN
jgi:hypothetical protein